MPRGTLFSGEEKGQIRAYKEEGRSNRWIAKKIGRSKTAVSNFVVGIGSNGKKKHRGRPRKLSDRKKRRILANISNSTKGTRRVRDEFAPEVSHVTVWRAIKSAPNIVRQRMQRCPKLTQEHKVARLNWAEQRVWWKMCWQRVIFTTFFRQVGRHFRSSFPTKRNSIWMAQMAWPTTGAI
jgi:hypothetical protein